MTLDTLAVLRPPLEECRAVMVLELERGEFQLPIMPQAASEVCRLADDPSAQISDLPALIERDQALAGHVLRAANSAAVRGSEEITSLQHAILRLGMRFVSNAAFAVSMRREIFALPDLANEAAAIWRQALAAGAFGREIARFKRLNVEGQYLCGLLHTVGKPVLLQKGAQLRRRHGWALSNGDLMELATDLHRGVGARLARAWNLPRQVAAACEHYLAPEEAVDFELECAMTYLSHHLARWALDGEELNVQGSRALELLNLYPEDVESLLEQKENVLKAVNALQL